MDDDGDASIEGSITVVGCGSLLLVASRKTKEGGGLEEAPDE
jgi:hypothetical protein